jgi:hypothetical protein
MIECICKFCQKTADVAPIKEMTELGGIVFFCHPCQAEYVFFKSGTQASQSLYTTINDKMYRFTTIPGIDKIYLWYVEKPGIPGILKNEKLKLIFSTEISVNNVTPRNINDKVNTWIKYL